MKIIKRHLLASHIKNTPKLYHYYRRLVQRIERKEPKIIELQFFDETTRKERLSILCLIAHESKIPIMVNPADDTTLAREIAQKYGLDVTIMSITEVVEIPYKAISADSKISILILDGVDVKKLDGYPEIRAFGFKESEDEKNKKNLKAIEERRRNRKSQTG